MFDDMLQEGMRLTRQIESKLKVPYEIARQMVLDGKYCQECDATGWVGHGMGGDTCGKCNGSGAV